MSITQLLFSTQGRATRTQYWLFSICSGLLSFVPLLLDLALGTFNEEIGLGILTTLYSLALIYPSIAVLIKRAHDRDHSGWYVLLMFIPLINIVISIELAFFGGTSGSNQYGPNPRFTAEVPAGPQP